MFKKTDDAQAADLERARALLAAAQEPRANVIDRLVALEHAVDAMMRVLESRRP